jgi:hypothetical protein
VGRVFHAVRLASALGRRIVGVAGELAVETESMAEDEAEGVHGRVDGLPTCAKRGKIMIDHQP